MLRFSLSSKLRSERGLMVSMEKELSQAAKEILNFWETRMLDSENGGCFGLMTPDRRIIRDSHKGLVLHCRVLWSFAFSAQRLQKTSHTTIAHALYEFLIAHFYDHQYGGFYWLIDARGQVVDSSKQIYGQAFAVFALAEYYSLTKKPEVRDLALELFRLLYQRCTDQSGQGFINSFSREWERKSDFRITEGQMQAPIHMNTMLHVLEAWTNLLIHTHDAEVKVALINLMNTFQSRFTQANGFLYSYFRDDLTPIESANSPGHDMEYIWMRTQALEYLQDSDELNLHLGLSGALIKRMMGAVLDEQGTLINLKQVRGKVVRERRWWELAESMMAYWCLYQRTADPVYLDLCRRCWTYIRKHFIIRDLGEWHWNVYTPSCNGWRGYLAGPWKTPYHSVRACLTIAQEMQQHLTRQS